MPESTDTYREEISQLRSDLNQLAEEKRSLVTTHRELVASIKSKISEIRLLKEKRDACTNAVKELKVKRTDLHTSIKEKVEKLHSFRNTQAADPKDNRLSPGMLKAEIRKIETRIETGAISFEEEKKLMRVMKDKQKQLKEAEKHAAAHFEERDLVGDTRRLREESDTVHKQLQENANESQAYHEKILTLSKEIDECREKEGAVNLKLDDLSRKIDDIDTILQESLAKFGKIRTDENVHFEEERKERKLKDQLILEEKERIAEEKLRKGLKLTTQDLLALQSKEMKDGTL